MLANNLFNKWRKHLEEPSDIEQFDDWVQEAAETERRLPPAMRRQKLASWPEYQQAWVSYGYEAFTPRLARATTLQIDRYEYILDCLISHGTEKERKIIWACAHSGAFRHRGIQWSKIGKLFHCDRRTMKKLYIDSLIRVHYKSKKKHQKVLYS